MENQPGKVTPASAAEATGSGGCMESVSLIFMTGWIIVTTGISQSISWVLEQQIFESAQIPDVRWLVALIFGLVILVPALIIWLAAKNVSNRRYFLAFLLAGEFALLMVPARLAGITAALETALLQAAGALVFLLVNIRRGRPLPNWRRLGIGLIVAGLLAYPWLLWGALGSAWDTLLNLVAALLFGASAGRVAEAAFRREDAAPARGSNVLLNGLVMALALMVMVTALGVNGNQGLLSMVVPVLGWALAALYSRSITSKGRETTNRPVLALVAGLAAFWPMALIDPDELQAVISLGIGELIQWANLAGFVALGIALLAGVLLVTLRSRLPQGRSALALGLTGLVWLGALGLSLGVGQPGLHGERLFVILTEQADLSGANGIEDYNQRRAYAYQTLVEKADATQAGLRDQVDRWGIPYQPYYLENALEVQGGPLVRLWLQSRPEVARVLDSPVLRPLPAEVPESTGLSSAPVDVPWNIKMIGADRVWSELNVSGAGVIVGQSDSGVQGDHSELSDSYRGQDGQNDYNWLDPWNHSTTPEDIGGHGTHTLGTVLGNRTGVAPDAQWIGCVNLARNLGNPALYLDCMQFMLAPFPQNGDPLRDGRPELGAHVLNNSWGCPPVEGCDPESLLPAVAALRSAGVFVVASAGNEGSGGCGSVSAPIALYDPVYSVGAVSEGGTLAPFSSIGPVEVDGSGRIKPDIAAPGVDVLSSYPGDTYSAASGTSMAGPHVAGVVALMWSANPDLIGDIDRTEQILNETASAYSGPLPECVSPGQPNNAVGYGIVDAFAAVSRAMGR